MYAITHLPPIACLNLLLQLIAELSHAALFKGYRRPFIQIVARSFEPAAAAQSLQPVSLGMARDIAFGRSPPGPNTFGASVPDRSGDSVYNARVKLYGEALAAAAAGEADQQKGLVTASAYVYCSGNTAYAEAWAAAYSEVLRVDNNGCLILEVGTATPRMICVGQCCMHACYSRVM
jgi:hypothetical protein